MSAQQRAALVFPAEAILRSSLERLPANTEKVLFFVPYHFYHQPPEGSYEAQVIQEFKRRVSLLVQHFPKTHLLDFMIPSEITTTDPYYLDKVHTTVEGGTVLAQDIYRSTREKASIEGRVHYLGPIVKK